MRTAGPLVIVGALCLACTVILGLVVVTAMDGSNGLDVWWRETMLGARGEAGIAVAKVLNLVGGGFVAYAVVPLGGAVVLALLSRWRAALYWLVCLGASTVVVQAVKIGFSRARPQDMVVESDRLGSFPSGHTANAATIVLALAVITGVVWVRWVGALYVVCMMLSRTYLSVHWLTDTVAGVLIGVGVVLLVTAFALPWLDAERAELSAPPGSRPRRSTGAHRAGRPRHRS